MGGRSPREERRLDPCRTFATAEHGQRGTEGLFALVESRHRQKIVAGVPDAARRFEGVPLVNEVGTAGALDPFAQRAEHRVVPSQPELGRPPEPRERMDRADRSAHPDARDRFGAAPRLDPLGGGPTVGPVVHVGSRIGAEEANPLEDRARVNAERVRKDAEPADDRERADEQTDGSESARLGRPAASPDEDEHDELRKDRDEHVTRVAQDHSEERGRERSGDPERFAPRYSRRPQRGERKHGRDEHEGEDVRGGNRHAPTGRQVRRVRRRQLALRLDVADEIDPDGEREERPDARDEPGRDHDAHEPGEREPRLLCASPTDQQVEPRHRADARDGEHETVIGQPEPDGDPSRAGQRAAPSSSDVGARGRGRMGGIGQHDRDRDEAAQGRQAGAVVQAQKREEREESTEPRLDVAERDPDRDAKGREAKDEREPCHHPTQFEARRQPRADPRERLPERAHGVDEVAPHPLAARRAPRQLELPALVERAVLERAERPGLIGDE